MLVPWAVKLAVKLLSCSLSCLSCSAQPEKKNLAIFFRDFLLRSQLNYLMFFEIHRILLTPEGDLRNFAQSPQPHMTKNPTFLEDALSRKSSKSSAPLNQKAKIAEVALRNQQNSMNFEKH